MYCVITSSGIMSLTCLVKNMLSFEVLRVSQRVMGVVDTTVYKRDAKAFFQGYYIHRLTIPKTTLQQAAIGKVCERKIICKTSFVLDYVFCLLSKKLVSLLKSPEVEESKFTIPLGRLITLTLLTMVIGRENSLHHGTKEVQRCKPVAGLQGWMSPCI